MCFIEDLLADLLKEDKTGQVVEFLIKRKVALCFIDLLVDLLMENKTGQVVEFLIKRKVVKCWLEDLFTTKLA